MITVIGTYLSTYDVLFCPGTDSKVMTYLSPYKGKIKSVKSKRYENGLKRLEEKML